MRFPSGLRALKQQRFRLFGTGQSISVIGSWMQTVGQTWLVIELTGSPFKLGPVGTLQFGPLLFLAVISGAILDRVPKRILVTGTQIALMLPASTLDFLAWTHRVRTGTWSAWPLRSAS